MGGNIGVGNRPAGPKTPGPLRWAGYGSGRAEQALRTARPMPGSRVGPTPMGGNGSTDNG